MKLDKSEKIFYEMRTLKWRQINFAILKTIITNKNGMMPDEM